MLFLMFFDIVSSVIAVSMINAEWLYKMTVQKLVIVIRSLDNSEVIERWQFNVECDKTNTDNKMYVSVHLF